MVKAIKYHFAELPFYKNPNKKNEEKRRLQPSQSNHIPFKLT